MLAKYERIDKKEKREAEYGRSKRLFHGNSKKGLAAPEIVTNGQLNVGD